MSETTPAYLIPVLAHGDFDALVNPVADKQLEVEGGRPRHRGRRQDLKAALAVAQSGMGG
jgi:hypothetical protein